MVKSTTIGFKAEDIIHIQKTTEYEAFYTFGSMTREIAIYQLEKKQELFEKPETQTKHDMMLSTLKELAKNPACSIDNTNPFARYYEIFRAYCDGARISEREGAFLQGDADLACQSSILHDPTAQTVHWLHTEENSNDDDLISYNTKKYLGDSPENHLYHYRLVHIQTPDMDTTFFGYPGIVFGAQAFGFNHTTQTAVLTDTLFEQQTYTSSALWASIIPAFCLMYADSEKIEKIFQFLHLSTIRINGGYATHILKPERVQSIEYAGSYMASVIQKKIGQISCLVQSNISLSENSKDFVLAHNSTPVDTEEREIISSIAERERVISYQIQEAIANIHDREKMQRFLETFAADPYGEKEDIEDKTYISGIVSPYEAAYFYGSLSLHEGQFTIGKGIPSPNSTKPYKLLYDENDPLCRTYTTPL